MRKHKKKIAIHFLIIFSFLIYLLLPDSFFERFTSNENIAKPQEISLPDETKNIKFFIDNFVSGEQFTEIKGWAFIDDGQSMEESTIYLVLKSDKETYVLDTKPVKRPDIAKTEGKPGQNLDDSGFYAAIPKNKLKGGRYVAGIYIKKPEIEAFQMTNRKILLE